MAIVKKQIKFDLAIDGVKVKTVEELREHITVEIVEHFKRGLLLKWLLQRDFELAEQFKQINQHQEDREILIDIITALGEIELDEQIIDALFEIPVKTKPNITKVTETKDKESVILVPDIGGYSGVRVAEVYVKVGDKININDNLIMLETDKATMEIPTDKAGMVTEILIQSGSKVDQGDIICKIITEVAPLIQNENDVTDDLELPSGAAEQYLLGNHYYDGDNGKEQNFAKALKCYTKSAEQGYSSAQFNLAQMYYRGEGVPLNAFQASLWFTKAATQGHPRAQFELGFMRYFGIGVTEDKNIAKYWFQLAAKQGLKAAQEMLSNKF